MNNENQLSDKKEETYFNYKKDNYDTDSPQNNLNSINNDKDNDTNKNNNKIKNEELNKKENNEEFIIFPKIKEVEDNKIIRISNLKDNELPLEDKIQIENQFGNDNDNESEQLEVIENILNNFGKEKYQNKFVEYKYKKKYYKSQSVNSSKNNILNKIKHDIAIINFEQILNKICSSNNHNLILKREILNNNIIRNKYINKNKSINNNILRIEKLRKKIFSSDNNSKTKIITNHKRNLNKLFFNKNEKEDNFFSSCNNFYNKTQKQKLYNSRFNDINNIKEIKINNFNVNHIYNNFYDTFRNKRINYENENNIILPINIKRKNNNSHIKTNESPNISLSNTNQFFYNVFRNSIKKYPYLHLLKNKVNKMKNDDLNQQNYKNSKNNIINKEEKEKDNENKISLLEKIKLQKDIFQREIDKYKKK